jgi:hypothetical protein
MAEAQPWGSRQTRDNCGQVCGPVFKRHDCFFANVFNGCRKKIGVDLGSPIGDDEDPFLATRECEIDLCTQDVLFFILFLLQDCIPLRAYDEKEDSSSGYLTVESIFPIVASAEEIGLEDIRRPEPASEAGSDLGGLAVTIVFGYPVADEDPCHLCTLEPCG